MIKLNFQNSNKYAGIIKLPILGEILEEFNVKFAATLVSLVSQPGKSRSKKSMRNLQRSQNCSARIVVYGLQCEKSAVGNILSDAGVYLQQPTVAECDKNIAYANPHYLIRPGSQMPDLEESPTLSDDRSNPGPERLNEVDKGRLMRIFDFANADNLRPPITPSPRLRSCLKDHQLSALVMMIEKECGTIENLMFPSLWQLSTDSGVSRRYRHAITGALNTDPTPLRGGILADDMGLGKTLSTLALICSSIDTQTNQNGSSADGMTLGTLIVTPKSTIPGWKQQIARHIRPACVRVIVYHGSTRQRMHTELEGADIVLTTYETLRAEWMTKGALYSEKWHRLVLDEAHRVRSRASQIFKAACAVVSRYRWCLTGTPIQNSLDDYGALLSFLGVPPFTEKSMFDFWIASPLTERRVGSLESLQSLVRATCLRRTKKMIGNTLELPRRLEEIEKVDFYHADDELYTFFKESTAKVASRLSSRNPGNSTRDFFQESNIISLMNFLRLICDHGKNLLPTSALAAWEARDRTSIDWRLMRNSSNRCDICDAEIERSDSGPNAAPHLQHGQIICTKCTSEYRDSPIDEARVDRPDDAPEVSTARVPDIPSPAGAFVRPSAKVERLLKNIATEQALNRHINSETIVKSVIFSYWTKMLNLIQQALESEGFCTQRIDGSSSLEQRSEALRRFREDPKCTVMLASIGSAGEGIDLTAASRVHLVEPHWNPMAEAQAVDRVHRIGQTREVVVTRYIMRDSIETYIQWVQQDKLRLINQSLDFDEYSQPRIDMDRWTKLRESLQ
ncbi:hypothetical protein EV356DRAFT_226832 [Viridothelium virens]|uniref:Uncharacterized protein n=1 Tax=Viridothelium virens TaxID=1048519 RepID=A0A6A6HLU9_VIRVR|nr:hypothetical protein EV356DRAFT_226832 [Viridothelium virens]